MWTWGSAILVVQYFVALLCHLGMWFWTFLPNFSSSAWLEVHQEPFFFHVYTWRTVMVPDTILGSQGHPWCYHSFGWPKGRCPESFISKSFNLFFLFINPATDIQWITKITRKQFHFFYVNYFSFLTKLFPDDYC